MGLAGILLKKRDLVDVWKIVNDLESSALQVGLEFRNGIDCEKNEDGSFNYLSANIANTFKEVEHQQQMLMYIYNISDDDYLQEFDWIGITLMAILQELRKMNLIPHGVIKIPDKTQFEGFMTALPATPDFITYHAVYLPKNHFIKEERMTMKTNRRQ